MLAVVCHIERSFFDLAPSTTCPWKRELNKFTFRASLALGRFYLSRPVSMFVYIRRSFPLRGIGQNLQFCRRGATGGTGGGTQIPETWLQALWTSFLVVWNVIRLHPLTRGGGGGGGERRLNSERYDAVRWRHLLLRIWVFFDWLLPFRNRKPFIIPKAVELNGITKHNKCKCEEFFFQTRRGGGICSYDVIMHNSHSDVSLLRAPHWLGGEDVWHSRLPFLPRHQTERPGRSLIYLIRQGKNCVFFLTNLVTMKTPNDERQTWKMAGTTMLGAPIF